MYINVNKNTRHHHLSTEFRVWRLTEIFSFTIPLNNLYIWLIWTRHWDLLSKPIICIDLCPVWGYNDLDLGSRICWLNKYLPFTRITIIHIKSHLSSHRIWRCVWEPFIIVSLHLKIFHVGENRRPLSSGEHVFYLHTNARTQIAVWLCWGQTLCWQLAWVCLSSAENLRNRPFSGRVMFHVFPVPSQSAHCKGLHMTPEIHP